ncbi:MAG: ABC transporter substrate-binding protein, partial [Pseudomonadota bacterium]
MLKKAFTTLVLCLFSITVYAAQTTASQSPLPLMKTVANQMLTQLKNNRSTLRRNPQMIDKIVVKVLLPHVDQFRMARSVVNPNSWRNATPQQKKAFVKQFRT